DAYPSATVALSNGRSQYEKLSADDFLTRLRSAADLILIPAISPRAQSTEKLTRWKSNRPIDRDGCRMVRVWWRRVPSPFRRRIRCRPNVGQARCCSKFSRERSPA